MTETAKQPATETENIADSGGKQAANQEGGQENKTGTKPEGWDHVDLPPALQKRFNRIYSEMKQSHRDKLEMADIARKALERAEEVERKLNAKEGEDRADTLKAMKVQALEKGDYAKVAEIDDQLTKLRAQPVLAKPQTKTQQANTQQSSLTPEQVEVIAEWAEAVDDKGSFARPWAHAGHPKHQEFIEHAQDLINDPKVRARGIGAVLDSIDRKMGSVRRAAVLSGDGGRAPNKISLSDDEKRVARLLYPKEKDPVARYMKAKEAIGKGARANA